MHQHPITTRQAYHNEPKFQVQHVQYWGSTSNTSSCGAKLYPPVIAKGRPAGTTEDDIPYLFATAILLDAEGNPVPEQLGGSFSAAAVGLDEQRRSSSSTGHPVAFMFPDLNIAYEGTYSIRVDVYRVDYVSGQGAILVDQVETRMFAVCDADVPCQRPSSDERSVLRKLRDQGYSVPSSPA
ncbi:unnamed protein product [Parascedosporium putredinis]|uniref:Velvet domain-containing protein n=1 Tax=Parascedosporium putredinis TaxID=1442378 RepID=A0A9P1H9K6_9PEZI|nr:unnamed protein product [Parascedosporium putredinis]CAI8001061.1 unnamed protein product [Parascedosporium putredinis]